MGCPLKLAISTHHCSMSTGIIPQYEPPSYINPLFDVDDDYCEKVDMKNLVPVMVKNVFPNEK